MGSLSKLNKALKNKFLNRGTLNAVIKSMPVENTGHIFNKQRKFIAYDKKGKFLGSLHASFTKGERVWVKDVQIRDRFQGKGLGTQLFNYMAKFSKKASKRFIWTESNILDPKMIKIREKLPTKNIASGLGRYGENSSLVSNNVAKKVIEKKIGFIKSVSDVKNIKFIRKNGRIIPIRIKK